MESLDAYIPKIIFPEIFIGFVAPVGANINSAILAFKKYFEENYYKVEEIKVTTIATVNAGNCLASHISAKGLGEPGKMFHVKRF